MWILLSFLAMLATSARFIFTKQSLQKQNEVVAITAMLCIATLIAAVYAAFSGIRISDNQFFIWMGVRVVLDSIALLTNFRAFKFQEVSFVMPLISLLPVLIIGSSFLLNGEVPSAHSLFGIVLVMVGIGILFSANIKWSSLQANRNLLKATGYMLLTICIWATVEAMHKRTLALSSPATYFFLSFLGFFAVFYTLSLLYYRQQLRHIFSADVKQVNILNGLAMSADRILSLNAVTTGFVAYVGAIKSSSTVVTTIFAALYLKEKVSRQEAIGIGLATLGVVVIGLLG